MTPQALADVPTLNVNLSELPVLIDLEGVNKFIAPMGRTLLYELASSGEIESASIGMKRGRRVFVTSSVVKWLQRRMATTQRPRMASRRTTATKRPQTEVNGQD